MPVPFRQQQSDEEEWNPPDYATPVAQEEEEWKPPDYAKLIKEKDEKPSVFSKAWKAISEPITELPTKVATKIGEAIDQPTTERSVSEAKLRGFIAGAAKGAGQFVSGLTSPLNLALSATGIGEEVPAIKQGAVAARRLLSLPVTVEGLSDVYRGLKEKDYSRFLTGGLEAAGGIAGIGKEKIPVSERAPTIKQRVGREIPYKAEDLKVPEATPKITPKTEKIYDESGRFLGEQPTIPEKITDIRDEVPSEIKQPEAKKPFVNPFEKAKKTEFAERQVTKGLAKEWKPPDYATPLEEPQAARTESGKLVIGADIRSLGKVLGTSLYKGDIAPIATKELLQNSIDATRHLGSEGKIDVILDRYNNTIHVNDNGRGLTKDELESVFTNLGASGKRQDISASGGFGLAKAAPLLGGERADVTSVALDPKTGKLMEHSFSGTPDELLEGVDIKSKVAPEGTQTGTRVSVKIPKDSNMFQASDFVENLSKHSNVESNIRLADLHIKTKPEDLQHYLEDMPKKTGKSITTLSNPSADVEMSEPESSTRRLSSRIDVHLLNNGMYQGTRTRYLDSQIPNVPSELTIDIKPKVAEGHSDYPFTANREELRGSTEEQITQYIDDNIVKPSIGKRADELKRLYSGMDEMIVGKGEFPSTFGRKISLYDPKGQLTRNEMDSIKNNLTFQALANNLGSILDEAMKSVGTQVWKDRLEKFGFIFDDKFHGIHIPNPGENKSAILVNPFASIGKMSPDEASANILHTILHEMAHIEPGRAGHDEGFTIRLGEIYGKFGARRSVEAQDTILRSIADPNTGIYNPEIQKILSTYKESRGRGATTEDLLSGTGIGSRTPRGRKEGISSGDRQTEEGAVAKLINAIGNAKELNVKQQAINAAERAKRFAAFESVKEEGAIGAAKSLSKLRGEYEKVQPGEALGLNQQDTDSLFTAVKKANITPGEKARGYTALYKILNGEGIPQRNELNILDDVFGNGFASKIIELHGGVGVIGIKIAKLANTMKSMENALSLAAPLRHGVGLLARKEFYPAFRDMFKFFGNKEFYNASMQAIQEDPLYIPSREAGLFLSKPGSIMNSEEEFLNSYAGEIPIVKEAVGASQRAYTGFLNKARFDTAKSMFKQAESLGNEMFTTVGVGDKATIVASKEAKDIAKYINTVTGRGDLGRLNRMTNELNVLLWSPRMMASRFQMFDPKLYTNLPKGMRLEGLKSLLGVAALGTTINALGAIAGAKISTNILSSDFMKSRFGTHVIDPWASFQQLVVGAARFLAGKKDSNIPTSRLDVIGQYLKNKESPAASLVHSILTAKRAETLSFGSYKDQYGSKTSIDRQIVKSFTPIFVQDLYDLANSQPDFSENVGLDTALGLGSLAGMEQTYPEQRKLRFSKMRLH